MRIGPIIDFKNLPTLAKSFGKINADHENA